MPDDPTAAARSRRYRERQAEQLPPVVRVPCQGCPTLHTGVHGDLCQRCWLRLTPEGRANVAERVRQLRGSTPRQLSACAACGGNSSGRYGPLCCRCWERITPEGRDIRAERLRRSRARRRLADDNS